MNFLVYRVGAFSHNKDQHTLHSLNAPRVDQHIFWRAFGREGFISFLTCFFIVFPNSLFCVIFQIFLRPPIGTKTDSECSAGRDLFHVFLKYSCFPKKAAAPAIFNYFNKILQQKHTVLEEADDTKCLCWELFLEIFLMTQLLCKKNLADVVININILGKGSKTKVYFKGWDQYQYFFRNISQLLLRKCMFYCKKYFGWC